MIILETSEPSSIYFKVLHEKFQNRYLIKHERFKRENRFEFKMQKESSSNPVSDDDEFQDEEEKDDDLPSEELAEQDLKTDKEGETVQEKKSETKGPQKQYANYSSFIYRVLKQVHPDIGMSKKAMDIVDAFVNDIFNRIALEAGKLARYTKRNTITSREIQTAVRLILPGELAKHAVSEGVKAVTKYNNSPGDKVED